jgi:hypothetical protein
VKQPLIVAPVPSFRFNKSALTRENLCQRLVDNLLIFAVAGCRDWLIDKIGVGIEYKDAFRTDDAEACSLSNCEIQ